MTLSPERTAQKFHLGWLSAYRPPAWNQPFEGTEAGHRRWLDGSFHVDVARQLERACFDVLLLEDASTASQPPGGSRDGSRGGPAGAERSPVRAPEGDPMALAPLLTGATKHLGVSVTASTSSYPPYVLARSMSTLDHLSGGRSGWNVVTSGEDRVPPHEERYEQAAEFVDLVDALWRSWEPDALVMDRETGTYVDHTKVHRVDFRGRHHSSRGPLNTLPAPQGRPVVTHAGTSPEGRELAARTADLVPALLEGVTAMKEYRDDVRARAAAFGRDPDDVKVMFVVSPVLGATEHEAAQRLERRRAAGPDGRAGSLELVGTPESVAAQMEAAMAEVGGDGFLVRDQPTTRQYVTEITDGLVPALQRRGLVRTEYTHAHLRDNLLEF